LGQLDRVAQRVAHLNTIYHYYEKALASFPFLQFVPVNIKGGEIPIYVEVLCQDRDRLVAYLQENGVQTRPYYPNLNLAPQLRDDSAFPSSAEYGRRGLFLPCGPSQPIENIDRVMELLSRFQA
jgi:dTDP-4-amino-4,6-dideoxygalactose transaminase